MKLDPWSVISRPDKRGRLNALRISSDHPHEIFRTRDNTGAYGLSIEFHGTVEMPAALPRLQGFTLWAGGEPAQLRLTLHSQTEWELFQVLSDDLARACSHIHDCQGALDSILARLERWQKLLAHDRSGLLSDQEVRGLFGELLFLMDELIPRFGSRAVDCWNGPDASPQDFAIASTVIEIKTRTGRGPARVRISSPEQLWPALPSMYLCVYYLAVNDPRGENLTNLVNRVRVRIEESAFLAEFERKLEAAGFMDLPEYEVTTFWAEQLDTYQVREGFPGILPSSVPDGVSHLSYDLSLDHCRPFSAPIAWHTIGE